MKRVLYIALIVTLAVLATSCHIRLWGEDPPGKVTFTIDATMWERLSCNIYYDDWLASSSVYAYEKFDTNGKPTGEIYIHHSVWELPLTGPAVVRIVSHEDHFDNNPASPTYGQIIGPFPTTASLVLYENDSPVATGIGQVEYRFGRIP